MNTVIAKAAMAAKPDREKYRQSLVEEMERLKGELERLDGGGEIYEASEGELREYFSEVVRELDDLPADFRRVEESMREMKKDIITRFNEEERPIGEVLDEYFAQSKELLTSTPAGRAYAGAIELLEQRGLLKQMRDNLGLIVHHPVAEEMKPEERRQLSSAVPIIRRGITSVTRERKHLTQTLDEHIRHYDHIENKALKNVLRDINRELQEWMKKAGTREYIEVDLIPEAPDFPALAMEFYNPSAHKPPAPLEDVSEESPEKVTRAELTHMSGPSLEALRTRVHDAVKRRGKITSAADFFNDLPEDLKRPVEVVGLMQVLSTLGGSYDLDAREVVSVTRADQSKRRFSIPVISVSGENNG